MKDKKSNFCDIALHAGVSASTVDRVLNGRAGVSYKLRLKVIAAARELGVPRVLPTVSRSSLQIDVVLPAESLPGIEAFRRALSVESERFRVPLDINLHQFTTDETPKLIAFLRRKSKRRRGLIILERDEEAISRELSVLIEGGCPVVALAAARPVVDGAHFAGIDSLKAARTLAGLMGQFIHRSGKVWIAVPNLEERLHHDRYEGFRQAAGELAPHLELMAPVLTRGIARVGRQALSRDLAKHGDIVGLYNTGGGSQGILDALRTKAGHHLPVWAGFGLDEEHAEMLEEGVLSLVVDQDETTQASNAIRIILQQCSELPAVPVPPTRFHIVTKENLGQFSGLFHAQQDS
ncbi:LacI family transcriptional regulator [Pseudoxanthomonas sp. GM95]|uniref:LacI family DNA-binding transcriptional regulator n=1 Tax=Pseudoxanthomonas sp. GM95 TaxID=1881043 RepID=UPI0008D44306|nr:LacI family DNA-binding transcriptional regulator [Pseudoxanthomonas sp. GM95]SEM53789.1 LacI family transcriptional regulator [Pseudoxanthomonas sp. GM95]